MSGRSDNLSVAGSPWTGALILFLLAGIACADLITGLLLWVGPSETPLGRFAADFLTWCFYADARTGGLNWVFPAAFFAESLLMASMVGWVGWSGLRALGEKGRPWKIAPVFLALGVSATGLYGLTLYSPSLSRGYSGDNVPFPAEDLRVSLPFPAFALVDQENRALTPADLQGKVTVFTAFYAHCFSACPAIFSQVRGVAEEIPPPLRERLQIVGVTMDPEKDDPSVLSKALLDHGLDSLNCRLATGKPGAVNEFLDALGVARKSDTVTGVIDHMGVLFLLDTKGRITYRFSVGETQKHWMSEALLLLLRESQNPSRT